MWWTQECTNGTNNELFFLPPLPEAVRLVAEVRFSAIILKGVNRSFLVKVTNDLWI